MTSALIGHGMKLGVGDAASPEVFTNIAEVLSINFSASRDTVDASNTDSTDGYREFIAGLNDGGEISIEANFLPGDATQNYTNGAASDIDNSTARNYKITWPDGSSTTLLFTGFLTALEYSASVEDRMTASMTFKVTGKPTLD